MSISPDAKEPKDPCISTCTARATSPANTEVGSIVTSATTVLTAATLCATAVKRVVSVYTPGAVSLSDASTIVCIESVELRLKLACSCDALAIFAATTWACSITVLVTLSAVKALTP